MIAKRLTQRASALVPRHDLVVLGVQAGEEVEIFTCHLRHHSPVKSRIRDATSSGEHKKTRYWSGPGDGGNLRIVRIPLGAALVVLPNTLLCKYTKT